MARCCCGGRESRLEDVYNGRATITLARADYSPTWEKPLSVEAHVKAGALFAIVGDTPLKAEVARLPMANGGAAGIYLASGSLEFVKLDVSPA